MTQAAGYVLGPFAINPAGTVMLREPEAAYTFRWRHRHARACLREDGLTLQFGLGRVPSTVQAASARSQLLNAVAALPPLLPGDWQLMLRPDHRLDVVTRLPVPWPLSAVDLLAAQTAFLLAVSPYVDALEEAGIDAC